MRRLLSLVLAVLLGACAGAAGTGTADPGSEPPVAGGGGGVDGSTGSGEILCPEPSPGSLPEPGPRAGARDPGHDAVDASGCEPPPDPGQGAELVTPRPGMAGTRPVAFTGAEAAGDGTTLRITWTSGVEPCNVLDRVEVAESPTEVRVTLIEGSDPASPDAVCIELGVTKAVEVPLAAPLGDRAIVDGAA